MKKYISHSFLLLWSFGAFILAAPTLHGQDLNLLDYYDGLFDVNIAFGCNSCDTNNVDANSPISMFLATYPVTTVQAAGAMAPLGQRVPPHYTELNPSPCTPFLYGGNLPNGLAIEGWTMTLSYLPAYSGTGAKTPGSFNPVKFQFPYLFYAAPLLSYNNPPPGGLPVLDQTACQAYPWDVDVWMNFANGQLYNMEQQLVVAYNPEWNSTPRDTPVDYVETNGLLTISLVCTNGQPIPISTATITATLDDFNIPSPLSPANLAVGGSSSPNLFKNWSWPLMPTYNPYGPMGAAGTIQAQLTVSVPLYTTTTIVNRQLLVRANRSYTLTIDPIWGIGFDNGGNPGQVSLGAVRIDTGLVLPCTNMQITISNVLCSGTWTNNTSPSPCVGSIIGTVDMLLGLPAPNPDAPINISASDGPKSNHGSQVPPLASQPGNFMITVAGSDAYAGFLPTDPNYCANTPYKMQATMGLGSGFSYEYFKSPILDNVYVPCGTTVNLSNVFVMCPLNPGIVQGTITLSGAVDNNPANLTYFGGKGALYYLQFANYPTILDTYGSPYDPPPGPGGGGQDLSLANVSYIQATGGAMVSPPGLASPLSVDPINPGGSATTEFDKLGAFLTPNTYIGNYSLQMAGLESQASYWSPNDLHLVFGAPVGGPAGLTYDINLMGAQYNHQPIVCGQTLTNNINLCFGPYTIGVINGQNPISQIYKTVNIQVNGTALDGSSYTVSSIMINDVPFTTTPNKALIPLFLPEGNYQYGAQVYDDYGYVGGETGSFSINCATNPCPTTNTIVLNTGYNQNSGTVYGFGAADAFWVVTANPTANTTVPRPATVIQPYSPFWQPPLPDSQWITSYPTAVNPDNGEYDFETYFCLEPGFSNVVVSVSLRADDAASVSLNDSVNVFVLTPPAGSYSMIYPSSGTASTPSWFKPGLNVLRVAVTNISAGAVGLNLTATVTGSGLWSAPCCRRLSGISGQKFYDLNGNGVRDPDDPPLSGWTMHLSNLSTEQTAVTDGNGYYYFQNLPAGDYTVTEVPQSGWRQTAPAAGSYTVTLGVAQQINGQDFGNTCTNNNTNCIQIVCPSNIVTVCTGSETPVYFTVTTNNLCSPNVPMTIYCSPLSGSLFPVGTTTVHCTAYNTNCESATCSFTVTVVCCVQPPPGMVDWWPFDETTGSTANDIVGAVNNFGTYNGSPTPTPGMVGNGLCFNGTSDFVVVTNHPEVNFVGSCISNNAESFSIDAWIRPATNGPSLQSLLDKRVNAAFPIGYSLYLFNGQLGLQITDGTLASTNVNNYYTTLPNPLLDGQWHFIAITVARCVGTNNVLTFYVDGNSVKTFSDPLTGDLNNSADLYIGRNEPAFDTFGTSYYAGCIDELEIFKRVLGLDEIQEIFNARSAGKCKPTLTSPTISPNGGYFTNSVTVTLADTNSGTSLYYTLDNSTPSTNSTLYAAPFVVTNTTAVKVLAFQAGAVPSAVVSATFINSASLIFSPGFVKQEFYPGATRADLESGTYTNSPTMVNYLSSFETPSGQGSNYAERVSGFFIPPVTGNYVFFIAAGDDSDLFLSTDATIENKRLIAQETGSSPTDAWLGGGSGIASQMRSDTWTNSSGLTPYANGIPLTAGQRYYMEGVHHQGNGDGAFAATYKLSSDPDPANGDAPKLTGSQLAVNAYNNTYITITVPPKNVAAAPGANATFTVTASSGYLGDPPGVAPPPISYQWQTALFGAGSFTSLSNATANSYTTPALTSGDDGSRFRVTLATAGLSTNSTSATLTVGTLKFTRVSASLGRVTLQWSGNAVLEQAPSLTGPWTPSANQNNPQTSPVSGASFYRLRQ